MHICKFKIAGVSYAPGEASHLLQGDQLNATHEKMNQSDSEAMRLDYGGVKFGYIPKPLNSAVLALQGIGFEFSYTVLSDKKIELSLDATLPETLREPDSTMPLPEGTVKAEPS